MMTFNQQPFIIFSFSYDISLCNFFLLFRNKIVMFKHNKSDQYSRWKQKKEKRKGKRKRKNENSATSEFRKKIYGGNLITLTIPLIELPTNH